MTKLTREQLDELERDCSNLTDVYNSTVVMKRDMIDSLIAQARRALELEEEAEEAKKRLLKLAEFAAALGARVDALEKE